MSVALVNQQPVTEVPQVEAAGLPETTGIPSPTKTCVQPRGFSLIGRKPTLGDKVVAVAFTLVVMGLVWLVWDQHRLLY